MAIGVQILCLDLLRAVEELGCHNAVVRRSSNEDMKTELRWAVFGRQMALMEDSQDADDGAQAYASVAISPVVLQTQDEG